MDTVGGTCDMTYAKMKVTKRMGTQPKSEFWSSKDLAIVAPAVRPLKRIVLHETPSDANLVVSAHSLVMLSHPFSVG